MPDDVPGDVPHHAPRTGGDRGDRRAQLHAPFYGRRARAMGRVMAALVLVSVGGLGLVVTGGTPGDVAAFLALGALGAWGVLRVTGVRAVPSEDGLVVRNVVYTTRLDWAQVVDVRFGGGGPWAQLDLSDGEVLPVMAVQRADGAQGEAEARRLATLVALHTRTDRDT